MQRRMLMFHIQFMSVGSQSFGVLISVKNNISQCSKVLFNGSSVLVCLVCTAAKTAMAS